MGIRVDYYSQADVSLEQIADLIRSSFVERSEQRLNMDGCSITSEKIKDVIDRGNDIVLTFENESNELVGADIIEVKSYRGGEKITYIIGLQPFVLKTRVSMWHQ